MVCTCGALPFMAARGTQWCIHVHSIGGLGIVFGARICSLACHYECYDFVLNTGFAIPDLGLCPPQMVGPDFHWPNL